MVPPPDQGRAIVIGYGRVGQLVSDMLERHQIRTSSPSPRFVVRARAGPARLFRRCRNTPFLKVRPHGCACRHHHHPQAERWMNSSARCAACAPRSSSSPAPATPSTPATLRDGSPTPCRKPSKRACSSPRRRSSASACRQVPSSPRSTRSATSSARRSRRRREADAPSTGQASSRKAIRRATDSAPCGRTAGPMRSMRLVQMPPAKLGHRASCSVRVDPARAEAHRRGAEHEHVHARALHALEEAIGPAPHPRREVERHEHYPHAARVRHNAGPADHRVVDEAALQGRLGADGHVGNARDAATLIGAVPP